MIHDRLKSSRGSAFIITMVLMGLLFLTISLALDTAHTDSEISLNQVNSDKAYYIAQAGIEHACTKLDADVDWRAGFVNRPFSGGVYTVAIIDSTENVNLADTVVVRAVGSENGSNSILELLMVQESYHPLYNHAIYAGNNYEYDPGLDSQNWLATLALGGTGSNRDEVTGDVFFNGNIDAQGDAVVDGSLYAGGDITGNAPTGSTNAGTNYLAPPDLGAMNYATTSDYYIGDSSPWDVNGHLTSTDPRHIFVKEFRSDLEASTSTTFDNTNYFFGDPYEGSGINNVSVSSTGNKKTYFVDGNLWIEPNGTTSQLVNGPAGGTQITVVVKGNIYFSDDLLYQNPDLDGIAFVAMTDNESYTDQNGNNQYDPGEPILHDDGDGIYEGPAEGSGNIRFGDPNGGPLGKIQSYLYAENNFEDYVLDGPDGSPQTFSVDGMLSAGNQMNIRRDYGGGHSKMTVTYDDRLKKGLLELPGLPKRTGGSESSWRRVAWREL